jgi:hypothetical protein
MGKATISVMSVRLSVRMKKLASHWMDFNEIWYLRIFRKFIAKVQVSLKSDNINGYFKWRRIYIFYHISLISSYNEKCSDKVLEKPKLHFIINRFFFDISAVCVIVWKVYYRAWQYTDDNMMHVHCMLDT